MAPYHVKQIMQVCSYLKGTGGEEESTYVLLLAEWWRHLPRKGEMQQHLSDCPAHKLGIDISQPSSWGWASHEVQLRSFYLMGSKSWARTQNLLFPEGKTISLSQTPFNFFLSPFSFLHIIAMERVSFKREWVVTPLSCEIREIQVKKLYGGGRPRSPTSWISALTTQLLGLRTRKVPSPAIS